MTWRALRGGGRCWGNGAGGGIFEAKYCFTSSNLVVVTVFPFGPGYLHSAAITFDLLFVGSNLCALSLANRARLQRCSAKDCIRRKFFCQVTIHRLINVNVTSGTPAKK
ncbi:MAG: hypothetical protein A3B08_03560 [Candidatus Taylorbacteria bacterium RIFCSPLOWO2_01_FULL_43_44]|nr:MAG: hypothetical protein A3B08_03560 [Candidatus Taylorbacteria bacterium RIFCSPLOWO2_01_FULL_43_44]